MNHVKVKNLSVYYSDYCALEHLNFGAIKGEFVAIVTLKGELVAIGEALMSAVEVNMKDKGLAIDVKKVFMEAKD